MNPLQPQIIQNKDKGTKYEVFPGQKCKQFSQNILQTVKQGSYGIVKIAKDLKTGKKVAIKQLFKNVDQHDGIDNKVMRQLYALKALKQCSYIVKLLQDFIIDKKVIYLVFQFYQTNLTDFINQKEELEPQIVKKIVKQILIALSQAHSHRFMHRDLKPDNILIQKKQNDFLIKVGDFGQCRQFHHGGQQKFTQGHVTLLYRSPQLIFGTCYYSKSVDIWSAGVIFYQLIFNDYFVIKNSQNQFLTEICQKVGMSQIKDFEWVSNKYKLDGYDQSIKTLQKIKQNGIKLDKLFEQQFGMIDIRCDLLKKMLRLNPQQRISAQDALNHPYFKQQMKQKNIMKQKIEQHQDHLKIQ